MEADARTPLLGPRRRRLQRATAKLCSVESWRRRVPITVWLPKYTWEYLLRDVIAGITVGLTSIPQGIAYAIVAGLPPQVGLYSSIFPGLVYMVFGSCKDVTVGPTAILAALLAKYVAQSADFAYLAAFLSGSVILLLGVLQLGFLLDFISKPVISGFTTAAALQIGASQLRSLFRVSGSSGGTFVNAIVNFFKNIKTVHLWDTLLGIAAILVLVILKKTTIKSGPSASACCSRVAAAWLYVVRARNALVVFGGAALAYALYVNGSAPLALTGKIEGGLPHFGPPPFSTVVNNQTLDFGEMLSVFGAEGFVMPLVAILESIAIAKAFAGSAVVDATQEMIALGACNIVSSFCQSMPTTGSFTRTALNHASGVVTPAGCFFKASLVLLAVTLLAPAFYFIPRCVLAAVILVAMASLIEWSVVRQLWRHSKVELAVFAVTVVAGAAAGLEYGILAGAGADALRALARAARPRAHCSSFKVGNVECVCVALVGPVSYAAAGHVPRLLRRAAGAAGAAPTTGASPQLLVLDGRTLHALDVGVAENLIATCADLEKSHIKVLLWNFPERVCGLLEELQPGTRGRLVSGPSIDRHVLGLEIDRRNIANNSVF